MVSRYRRLKIVALLCFALFAGSLARGGEPSPDSVQWQAFRKTVQPFFAKHCYECHTEKKRGEVRLDQFQDERALAKGLPTLSKVGDVLRQHVMPPKKRPRPRDGEIEPVLAWLDAFVASMDRQSAASSPAVMRRLNRVEYNNTVRDLLGVRFQPAEDFPPDVPGNGFDNSAGTLTIPPVLVEKYLAAAEKVARTAVFGAESMKPERVAHQPAFAADAFSKNKTVQFDYDETGMSLPNALHVTQRFAVDGEYKLRCILRGWRPVGSDPVELAFWIDGKMVHTTKVEVLTKRVAGRAPGEMNGLWAEFRTPIRSGEHWLAVTILRMYEGLPPDYKGPKPAKTSFGISKSTDAFFPMYLDVVGPYQQTKGPSPESLQKIFGERFEGPRDVSGARKILAKLAHRAYRRPVMDKEVEDLVRFVDVVQKDGGSFEEGLCLAIERMLVSPHFLFRVEKDPPAERRRLSDHELATRLSYFLWSSMPDEELLHCADEQKLHQPEMIERQVRRMLKDARASALVENFGGQWLRTQALEGHLPDRTKFPEFTDYTRMSMKKETELFFEHILHEDRPILDFIDANYTFLNQRLGEFYGIGGVKGHEFRKVDLTGTGRGGVLTHASVLTVSSYPNRTSPVLRGKWILENILNAPPPPPPPNVPSLDENAVGKAASLREQLEKHRANATCASCHARMDPLGFAFECFDAIGKGREKDGTFAIETSGTLPDGRSFKDHAELRALLKADASAFTECLTAKMLTYALGRGLERPDKAAVKEIANRVSREGYRFSSLVLGIVQSAPFQMQKASRAAP
jgi:hypothetical protein